MNLEQIAKNIRTTVLRMIFKSKSSHIGSAFSITEIMAYIYTSQFKDGDKVLLSKGHAGSVLYATLAEIGKINKEDLINTYCTNGQKLGGHVTLGSIPGVDITAGSLGHGLSIGIGMALSLKTNKVYVILGDGEINEGSVWEGFLFAQQKKLSNLIVIIDRNKQQAMGHTKDIINISHLDRAVSDLGWYVQTINGNDFNEISHAFLNLSKEQPNLIIADTIKGKGVDFMEDKLEFHYRAPNQEEFDEALIQINK